MEWILSWVKNGLLFGIVSSVILMLCPNKSYAKHIGLVVGLLFILVMLHPVMELLQIDSQTYLYYIRDFFAVSDSMAESSDKDRELYEEALSIQIKMALEESGYLVDSVKVHVGQTGEVERICVAFDGAAGRLDILEQYLQQSFGEGVVIEYEGQG